MKRQEASLGHAGGDALDHIGVCHEGGPSSAGGGQSDTKSLLGPGIVIVHERIEGAQDFRGGVRACKRFSTIVDSTERLKLNCQGGEVIGCDPCGLGDGVEEGTVSSQPGKLASPGRVLKHV